MAGYVLLLSVAIAGLAGLGWWVPFLGGIALHLTVAEKYWPLWQRARAINQESMAAGVWALSVVQGIIAAGAAYGLGRLVHGLLWLEGG